MSVDCRKHGSVATVTLNRPAALNAFDLEQLEAFIDVFSEIGEDGSIRCVVLTGEGNRSFAAGADIKAMAEMDFAAGLAFGRLGQAATRVVEELPQPVIAAVNGFALGGGCEIAIAADIRYCSDNAVFSQPEVSLGIPPGWGGSQRLPRLIGTGYASEMILSGRRVDANEALRIGLVNRVTPIENLLETTYELAKAISANGPLAVRAAKRLMRLAFNESQQSGFATEVAAFAQAFAGQEQRTGMRAFVQKEKPEFEDVS